MYNHNLIEKKWQKYWEENKTYAFVDDLSKPKYYVLDMFPYPSGQGLHVGHPKGYTATDVIARYKRFNGYCVLHPIGWDAFGLPAEQFAIKTGHHPKTFTLENINHFRQQIKSIGFSYDYNKEVNTTDPKYYKWTQWIFSKMFEKGLAEVRDVEVNWCEGLGTVLSNEEVLNKDGHMVSERGEFPVIKKPMRQWVLKITEYADKLIEGLNDINWPESLKSIQTKWIGKSFGVLLDFQTEINKKLTIFTTRIDTIYGVSYVAIAPEHPLANEFIKPEYKDACESYIAAAKAKSSLDRKSIDKDQTGVFTGSYVINPINNKKVPLYIADYVLMDYATGVVMAVPAHDERDFAFAKRYSLPINWVIETQNHNEAYTGNGKHINSPLIDGMENKQAIDTLAKYVEDNNLGKKQIFYKLKDWIFSRQRYWGEPFPIVFDENNNPFLVKDLPLLLPECDDFIPSKDGRSPLAKLTDWVNITTTDGKKYVRETNTMPQWAGSCWYYIGYVMKNIDGSYEPLDSKTTYERLKRWLPVDLYVGGQEHAVLHLLYARFWHRFLYDIGVVPTKEPFFKLMNQGMILGSNGEKMSKSKGNVINPDEIIQTHGADALRMYEMFMGPLGATLPWTEEGLNGVRKWLDRVERFFELHAKEFTNTNDDSNLEYAYHNFIKNVSSSLEAFHFNVAISDMMIFINACYSAKSWNIDFMVNFLKVLSCFAPHLAEELNQMIGNNSSITIGEWPKYNPQNIGNVSKDETNLIDESFYEEYVPIQKNSRLFKFLLNATKIEIKFNSLIKLVSRTSLFELGFWVFGFFLFIASSSDMWLIWLLVLHIFKGVYGILLLEAIPKTQDIIETVASKPNVEEDKIMELIQEEIKNSFIKKWTDNKGKFFCYFITTIISVFIDIIIFIVQIAAFGKDEWILMQTCMLFIMLVFIISDIIYFLWFFTIKFSLSEDIYDAVRKAIFGSVTDLKSLVLSKFKRNSNIASN